MAHQFGRAVHLAAVLGLVAAAACAGDQGTVADPGGALSSSAQQGASGTQPDTGSAPTSGEWHLATIHGLVLGIDPTARTAADTVGTTNAIAGAQVEIHKVSFDRTTGCDTGCIAATDRGVVATLTTNASGRFEYVLTDPIIVKSGQAPPTITYRAKITPPAGSPFAATNGMLQIFFAEQLPGDGTWRAYLVRSKG